MKLLLGKLVLRLILLFVLFLLLILLLLLLLLLELCGHHLGQLAGSKVAFWNCFEGDTEDG